MLGALGRWTYRRRWPVLAVWLGLVLAGAASGGAVFDRLSTTDSLRPDAESQRADRRIDQLLPEGPTVVAVVAGREVYEPGLVSSISTLAAEIRQMDGVVEVDDLYTAPGGQIGADNRSTLVTVELSDQLAEADRERVEDEVAAALRRIDAPQVLVGGEKLAERAFAEQAVRDAARGEAIALVVLVGALFVILGGLVAALIPLSVALGAVAVTLLGLLGLLTATAVSEFTVNVVTLLGIGLAVDYALLFVARFREERTADPHAPVADLMARTTATAGRAVLVSGLAVAAAMGGLFVFAEPLLSAMALGGTLVVVAATALGLTGVPALIAVAHRVIAAGRGRLGTADSPGRAGTLARLARAAQRRPGPVAGTVSAVLLLLAVPFLLDANLANSDARALPRTMEARQANDLVQRNFAQNRAAPVVVVVDADPATGQARDLLDQLNRMPNVDQLQPRIDVPGAAAILDLTPTGETGGPQSRDLVRAIRALDTPVPLLVGGPAAEIVDYQASVAERLPYVLLVLLLATAVLLFALTGSVVVPVKALLMNALTLLATLGILVVVFQWGVGAALLGVEPWGAIDLTTPVLLFVFVFALTTDYEVFLLSRITEEWRRSRSRATDRAVLAGIARTGPVVSGAAVCITIVFLGFLLGDLTAVKEIGFGLAVAVLLDVTVVRGLLLPAVMRLLGEWNWWAPGPLRRLHERLSGYRLHPASAGAGQQSATTRAAAPAGRGSGPPTD
ncbi:MAG TPA: MMPL family transporter [Micromonosporaceae bacterium]|nr:MMPL family transporter [Micromonosporaceae bacterium]